LTPHVLADFWSAKGAVRHRLPEMTDAGESAHHRNRAARPLDLAIFGQVDDSGATEPISIRQVASKAPGTIPDFDRRTWQRAISRSSNRRATTDIDDRHRSRRHRRVDGLGIW